MEKKTMDTLRTMICGELDDIARKGISDHETLDVLKDLLDSAKNIEKIEKYAREKEESEKEKEEMGYSQRSMGRYYVDGTYDRGNSYMNYDMGNSYRGGNNYMNYDMGNSYRGYPMMYEGNSYMYREPMMDYSMGNGYSGTMAKEDITNELRKMMSEATDEKTRTTISEIMAKIK